MIGNLLKTFGVLTVAVSIVACGSTDNNVSLDDKAEQIDIPTDKSEAIIEKFTNIKVEYVGQIDNNTIEVIKEGSPISFQLETEFDFSTIKEGSIIFIDYVIERIPVKDGEVVTTYITNIRK